MSESSLSISLAVLQREVGRYLGFDRTPANWASSETTDVGDIIDSGARNFYHPPVLPGERTAHRWSFLRQLLTIATAQSQNDYPLPDLFGGFVGQLAFAASDNVPLQSLKETSIAEILSRRQLDSSTAWTGPPQLFAVYANPSDGTGGQRFILSLWPSPDNIYSLTGPYFIDPYSLNAKTYPLGGQPHSETFIEACLAAAELKLNGGRGPHYQQFIERLAASVSFDRGVSGPMVFGYNADRSETGDWRDWRHQLSGGLATYNNSSYQP